MNDINAAYRTIFERSRDAILVTDTLGICQIANRSAHEMFDYANGQLIGCSMADLIVAQQREAFRNSLKLLQPGEINDEQRLWARRDGSVFKNRLVMYRQSDGLIICTLPLEDANDRAERALIDSAHQLHALLNALPEPAFILNRDLQLVICNRALADSMGYRVEYMLGKCMRDLLPDQAVMQEREKRIQEVFATQQPVVFEDVNNGKYFRNYLYPVQVNTKGIEGVAVFAINLSEIKAVQDRITQSEAHLSAIIENTPNVAIQMYDAHGKVLSWNKASEAMFGFKAEEAVGKTLDRLIHTPEEFEQFLIVLENIERSKKPVGPVEYAFRRKDGSQGWCLSTTFGIPSEQPLFICMDVDMTARKAAELRYRIIFDHAPEALVVMDLDTGLFIDSNSSAERMFKYTAAQLKKMNPVNLSRPIAPDGRPTEAVVREYTERVYNDDKVMVFEWTHLDRDGHEIECEIRLVRLPDPIRRLVRGSFTDIGPRKRLEEQLRQAQKVESIGRLAGGVAHDFNNLLTSIIGFVELTRIELGTWGKSSLNLDRVMEAAQRGAELTQQLLAFARKKIVHPELVNLNDAIRGIEPMLRRLIGEDLEFVFVPGREIGLVKVDLGSLEQVIVNLAVNARDAMPGRGKLTLETANAYLDQEYVQTRDELTAGRYVMFAVADTGIGMTEEIQRRAFEPFFTTKPVGQGTGLGLSMCHGIVKQAGGHIAIYSESGKGTTVKVFLPYAEDQRTLPAHADEPVEQLVGGSETILFVEDDPLVREFGVHCLQQLGYKVIVAANGAEALEKVKATATPIRLLITDVVMPRMSGPELARQLKISNPEIAVLFASGYTENAIVHHGILNPDIHFLQKPYSPLALAQKIRIVIENS